jgi:hypothetical protein
MEEPQKPTAEQLRAAQEIIDGINSQPAEEQAEVMLFFISQLAKNWADDSLQTPLCFHCKETVPGFAEHWRDCPSHPARAVVAGLLEALECAEDATIAGSSIPEVSDSIYEKWEARMVPYMPEWSHVNPVGRKETLLRLLAVRLRREALATARGGQAAEEGTDAPTTTKARPNNGHPNPKNPPGPPQGHAGHCHERH